MSDAGRLFPPQITQQVHCFFFKKTTTKSLIYKQTKYQPVACFLFFTAWEFQNTFSTTICQSANTYKEPTTFQCPWLALEQGI